MNIANLGDAMGVRGSASAGSLYVSLHTSDPGVGGSQATNGDSVARVRPTSEATFVNTWIELRGL